MEWKGGLRTRDDSEGGRTENRQMVIVEQPL